MKIKEFTNTAFVIKQLRAASNSTCPGWDRGLLIELEKTTIQYFQAKKATNLKLLK
tara:strand:- start:578 stop:745 length:168 start_codon:yes stop_codon:yes gene_type:complete